MLSFFKKRPEKEQLGLFSNLQTAIKKRQQVIAQVLTDKSSKLSRSFISLLLVLYCFCYGAACVYVAITAFKDKAHLLIIAPIGIDKGSIDPRGFSRSHEHDPAIQKLLDSLETLQKLIQKNHPSLLK